MRFFVKILIPKKTIKNVKKVKKSKKTEFFLMKKREVKKRGSGPPKTPCRREFPLENGGVAFFWAPRGPIFFHFFCVFFHFFSIFFIFFCFLCNQKKRHFFHFFSLFLHVKKRPIRGFAPKICLIFRGGPMIFFQFFFIFFLKKR